MSKDEQILIALAIGAVAFYAGMVYAKRAPQTAQAAEVTQADWFAQYSGGWR